MTVGLVVDHSGSMRPKIHDVIAAAETFARASNPDDQRSHLLTLSTEGWALYEQVAPKALELERRIFAGFSAAERAQLEAMLARIEAAAETLDARG